MTGALHLFWRFQRPQLRQHPIRTGLIVVGIGAAVALVTLVMTLQATLNRVVDVSALDLTGRADIVVTASTDAGLDRSLVREIAGLPGVEAAVPVLHNFTRVAGRGGKAGVMLLGLDLGQASDLTAGARNGTPIEVTGGTGPAGRGLIASSAVLSEIDARLGDTVRLDTPTGAVPLPVTGTIHGSSLAGGQPVVVATPKTAQALLGKPGRFDALYVASAAGQHAAVAAAVKRAVAGSAIVGRSSRFGERFERALSPLTMLGSLTAVIALCVAFFLVYTTTWASVAERRRETAVMLTLGATRAQTYGSYAVQGLVLGGVAAVGGVLVGLGGAFLLGVRALEELNSLPLPQDHVIVHLWLPIAVLVAGILVCVAATLLACREVVAAAPAEAMGREAPYEWSRRRAGDRRLRRRQVAAAVASGALGVAGLVGTIEAHAAVGLAAATLLAWLVCIGCILTLVSPLAMRLATAPLLAPFGAVGRLARAGLEANPGRTALMLGAIFIPSAMVVGIGGAVGSYRDRFEELARGWVGAPAYVLAGRELRQSAQSALPPSVGGLLARQPGVRAVYPYRWAFGDLHGEPAVIYAEPIAQARDAGASAALSTASPVPPAEAAAALGRGEVLVSRYTANRAHVGAGGSLTLPTPSGEHRFRVAGVFDDVLAYDSIFMEYREYTRLWHDDRVSGYAVFPKPGTSVDAVLDHMREVLPPGVAARAVSRDGRIAEISKAVDALLALIAAIQFGALGIAALAIMNTMVTVVVQRRWEIALQRLMGMTRRAVGGAVMLEATAVGVVGGAGAAVLGTAVAVIMTSAMSAGFAWEIPATVPWLLCIGAMVGGAGASLQAAFLPSRAAAQQPVATSLRRE